MNKWVDATQNTKSISKESLNGTYHVGETSGGEVGICLKNGVCFIAGTFIYLSSGQFKPIEHIKADDQVYSGNPENCLQRPKDVEVTFVRTTPVLVKPGFLQENIYATPEHPFFNLSNKQILAGNLKKGDTLKTYDSFAIVQSTRSIDTTATVYNFHVQDFHTYFVGKTKLWVHNMMSHFRFDPAIQKKIDDLKITDTKTLDALASDISNSNQLEQVLVKNTELVEGWRVLHEANERSLTKNVKSLQNVTKHIEAIKKVGGYDDWKKVQILADSWSDSQKKALNDALKSLLGDKVRKASKGKVYSKDEKMSFELMTWARVKFFKDNASWLKFATSPAMREHFRAQRFVMFMSKSNPPINISLGSREAAIPDFAKHLSSTSFHDFYLRGFSTRSDLLQLKQMDNWLPIVGRATQISYNRGGKIYYHLDLITDFKALYDPKRPNFEGGTITELRYLIGNDLVNKGVVEFRLGFKSLSADKLKELKNAIKEYEKFVAKDPDRRLLKGKYNIHFK